MGLCIIAGGSGAGKTEYIYRKLIELSVKEPEGRFFVVTPEQATMHNPMLSSCYMKKNVPWHVSTPCTLFCDRLRLRAVCASGHSEHIILSQPYMLRRELSSSLSRSYRSRIFLLRLSYRLRDHESFSCSSHRIYKIFREKDLFHEFKNKDHRP